MRRAVFQPVSDATFVLGASLLMNRDVRVLSTFRNEVGQPRVRQYNNTIDIVVISPVPGL